MFSLIWSCDLSWYVLFYGIWKIKSILEGQGLSFGWPQFRVVGWAKASILNVKSCILCMFCLSTCRWLCVCLVGLPCVWHPAPCQIIICFMTISLAINPALSCDRNLRNGVCQQIIVSEYNSMILANKNAIGITSL